MQRLAFCDHTAQLGGAELNLYGLAKTLDGGNWQLLALMGERGPLSESLASLGICVDILKLPKGLLNMHRRDVGLLGQWSLTLGAATLAYILGLAKWMLRNKVDLIHTNSLKSAVLGGMAGRVSGIPVVWQVHSVVAESKGMRQSGVRIMRGLARVLPHAIVCNSQTTALCFSGIPNVTVIPCGVESSLFHPNGRRREGRARVGMVARFSPEKGQHVLVDAAERLLNGRKNIEFVLAGSALFGEDAYEAEIRRRISTGHMTDRISMPGFTDDAAGFISGLDVVVHPSVEPEGFGLAVAEAMMSGKPVIASAAGGSAELIEDGVSGRLVAPGDAEALAQAIDDLVSNPEKASQMGHRAREVALERYDIRKTTAAIEAVYTRALAKA